MMNKKRNKDAAANREWFNNLDLNQRARLAALVEGVNIIADMAEERNVKFAKLSVKIPELKRYVDSTSTQISKAWHQG